MFIYKDMITYFLGFVKRKVIKKGIRKEDGSVKSHVLSKTLNLTTRSIQKERIKTPSF